MPYNPDNNPWSRSRFKGLRWADQWGKPTRDWGIYGTRFMHTPTAEEEEAMANNSSLQAALMLAVAQAPDSQTTSGPVNKDGKPKESSSPSMGQEGGAPEGSNSPSMGQEGGAPDSVIEDTNSRQKAAMKDSTLSQNGGPEEYTQSVLAELKAHPELLNQAQQSIDRGGAQGLNEYFNQRYPRVGGLKFLERSHPSAQVVVSMAERMDIGLGVERVLSKIRSLAQLHANPRLYKMAAQSGAELFAASRSAMSMNPFEYGVLNRPRWERVGDSSLKEEFQMEPTSPSLFWKLAKAEVNNYYESSDEKAFRFNRLVLFAISIREPDSKLVDPRNDYNVGQANCIATSKCIILMTEGLLPFLTPPSNLGAINNPNLPPNDPNLLELEDKRENYMVDFMNRMYPDFEIGERENRDSGDNVTKNWNRWSFSGENAHVNSTYSSDNLAQIKRIQKAYGRNSKGKEYTFSQVTKNDGFNLMRSGKFLLGNSSYPSDIARGLNKHNTVYYLNPFNGKIYAIDSWGPHRKIYLVALEGIPFPKAQEGLPEGKLFEVLLKN